MSVTLELPYYEYIERETLLVTKKAGPSTWTTVMRPEISHFQYVEPGYMSSRCAYRTNQSFMCAMGLFHLCTRCKCAMHNELYDISVNDFVILCGAAE